MPGGGDQNEVKSIVSYCRQCGGERHHSDLATRSYPWNEDDTPVSGCDTWSMLECGGCRTVTFVHTHWFSEDYEMTKDGLEPILHRELYPPSPKRKMPEWGSLWFLSFSSDEQWLGQLHRDIYNAAGINSFALASMGARAIIDYIVTKRSGLEISNFKKKLEKMAADHLIDADRVEIYDAAFDAGSAAAHRGFRPEEASFYTLIEVAEELLEAFYIKPAKARRLASAARDLKAKTPQWSARNKS